MAEEKSRFEMAHDKDKTKVEVRGRIISSRSWPNQVSIRGADGEADIRSALTEAGFQAGDEIVITLVSREERTDTKPKLKLSHEGRRRKVWVEMYGDDDDPITTWEEFKTFTECSRCGTWQEGQCVCYAR